MTKNKKKIKERERGVKIWLNQEQERNAKYRENILKWKELY